MADGAGPGAWNMAVDHALALRSGVGVLRWYRWEAPTLSFGRNEPLGADVRERWAEAGAPPAVRRPTGGRAVLHDRELTYAVVVPRGWPARSPSGGWTPRTLYAAVHEGLVEGLRWAGVPATVVRDGRVLPPGAGPCFQVAAPGEVALGEGKLVGSAQARIDGALLQHGSILLGGDQSLVDRIVGRPPAGRAATLAEAPGPVPADEDLIGILAEGVLRALGGVGRAGSLAPAEEAVARELLRHYEDPAWTWKC